MTPSLFLLPPPSTVAIHPAIAAHPPMPESLEPRQNATQTQTKVSPEPNSERNTSPCYMGPPLSAHVTQGHKKSFKFF